MLRVSFLCLLYLLLFGTAEANWGDGSRDPDHSHLGFVAVNMICNDNRSACGHCYSARSHGLVYLSTMCLSTLQRLTNLKRASKTASRIGTGRSSKTIHRSPSVSAKKSRCPPPQSCRCPCAPPSAWTTTSAPSACQGIVPIRWSPSAWTRTSPTRRSTVCKHFTAYPSRRRLFSDSGLLHVGSSWNPGLYSNGIKVLIDFQQRLLSTLYHALFSTFGYSLLY
ncbi:uncharacterized protein LOC110988188 isoform X1 [Acanthaster planci]|uniref:Uncharacterized protein LOC110988188 isoform X1 n=1 Tax=Acanthaster planci TaxID=133434 RepID=A0A8B7ZNK7_ACAPL|nr:uncharacterized protein LOC110988188 isoform X1 [Acanthaster planci]